MTTVHLTPAVKLVLFLIFVARKGTLVLLAMMIPGVHLLGISFEDDVCPATSDCSLGVESCELLRCDCPIQGASCKEKEACGSGCTLNQLKTDSCCDFIPQQFHSHELTHVLHIETYTNVTSSTSDEIVHVITVWTQLNSTERWKLLQQHVLNMTNTGEVAIPYLLAVTKSLYDTIADFVTALGQIDEAVPHSTSLQEGLDELQRSGECHRSLACDDRIVMECECLLCEKMTDTVAPEERLQNMTMPTGHFITEVGNHLATSIGVSSTLSGFYGPDNTVNEWADGTLGGWAPTSTDDHMYMSFHNLKSAICGIVIQGVAGSTFRTLERFKVSVGGNILLDEEGDEIVYTSGVLLDSKSIHIFPRPVNTSSCLQIEMIQPTDPTRVGFRVGLIGCSNSNPLAQPLVVCHFLQEVVETVTAGLEELDEEEELDPERDPAQTSVAIYGFILQVLADEANPDKEFNFVVNLDTVDAEINLAGVKKERLVSEGFTFENDLDKSGIKNGTIGPAGGSTVGPAGGSSVGPAGGSTDGPARGNMVGPASGGITAVGGITPSTGGHSPTTDGSSVKPTSDKVVHVKPGVASARDDGVQSRVSLAIPRDAFIGEIDSLDSTTIVIISVIIIKADADNASSVMLDAKDHAIGSPIVQINTFVGNDTYQLTTLNYTVHLKNDLTDVVPVCSFFEEDEYKVGTPVDWQTKGCNRVSSEKDLPEVTCHCVHSTSYAVLLQVGTSDSSKEWRAILSVVSTVGLTLSIIALTLALLVYFLLRANISSARYAIHANLMVALLLSSSLFVSGLLETTSDALCYISKYLMTYLIFATFCWMLAEGIHLYRQIITVFESERKQNWLYFVVGWGLPLVLTAFAIGLTVTSPIRTQDPAKICWYPGDGTRWIILGPVLIIIMINLLILTRVTLIVVKAVRFQVEKEASETIMQVKAGLRSALLLMPLLGTAYLLSVVTHHSEILELLYNLLNSLQGFFIALFYCVMNTEVRNAINTYIRRSKEQSTLQGSTTGLKGGESKPKRFLPNNKVSPGVHTQFTFTTGSSQSKLSRASTPVEPITVCD